MPHRLVTYLCGVVGGHQPEFFRDWCARCHLTAEEVHRWEHPLSLRFRLALALVLVKTAYQAHPGATEEFVFQVTTRMQSLRKEMREQFYDELLRMLP